MNFSPRLRVIVGEKSSPGAGRPQATSQRPFRLERSPERATFFARPGPLPQERRRLAARRLDSLLDLLDVFAGVIRRAERKLPQAAVSGFVGQRGFG